jgi:carbon storage regulator CsrA
MLVLSRKQGEVLKIGDDITVTVLSVQGNTMRIGIQAPSNVRVLRGELQDWSESKPRTPQRRNDAMSIAG